MSRSIAFGGRALAFSAVLTVASSLSGPALSQTFSITGVQFDESAYLPAVELQEIAARYVSRPIAFEDLEAMLGEINQAYALAGVVTAQAILPPQDIVDGILQIRLVEAKIETVETDLERTNRQFMLDRISLDEGELPDFEQLEIDLRLFEIAHDFRPVLSFGPGEEFGFAQAVIGGDEPPRFSHTLSADNYGSPSTGEHRLSYFGRWSSVTGRRDILSLQLMGSQGAYSAGLGYSVPVGRRGGRVIASARYADSEVISDPFAPVNIVSTSASGSLSYSQPFRVRADSHWGWAAELRYEQSEARLSQVDFLRAQIYDFGVSVNYQRIFPRAVLGLGAGLRYGNAEFADTTETEGPFYILQANASYARRLGDWGLWTNSATLQYAHGENLPYARLLNVGGATSVRGYPNAVRSGDSGLIVQTQIARANPYEFGSDWPINLTPFAFMDAALIVPYRETGDINPDQDFLASIGAGVRFQVRENLNGTLVVALPLLDTLGFDASQGGTVYFGLDWTF